MFKLIALVIETGIVLAIAYLFHFLLRKERGPLLPKGHYRTFALLMWLVLVILKLNSFWLNEGGIEYRRLPVYYPYEIRETEIGTCLLKNGSETGLPAIDGCDIAYFSLQQDKIVFQCTPLEKTPKVFSFKNNMLIKTPAAEHVVWTSFEREYCIYHYFKVDLILVLILTGLLFYFQLRYKNSKPAI